MDITRIAVVKKIGLLLLLSSTGACSGTQPTKPEPTQCKEPRPEICTMHYSPVCATRDNGVRCITAPCPSTEMATYSNACMACADAAVISHRPGECKGASK